MLSITEQSALMRLGLRYIRENRLEGQWVGRVPTSEEIDEWLENQMQIRVLVCQQPVKK